MSPMLMNMAKKLIENMDADQLRDLAKRTQERANQEEGAERGQSDLPDIDPAMAEQLLEKLSEEDLHKLGEAFADLKDNLPQPEQGPQPNQRDQALQERLRERMQNMDPELMEKLRRSFPQPQPEEGPREGERGERR